MCRPSVRDRFIVGLGAYSRPRANMQGTSTQSSPTPQTRQQGRPPQGEGILAPQAEARGQQRKSGLPVTLAYSEGMLCTRNTHHTHHVQSSVLPVGGLYALLYSYAQDEDLNCLH